MRTRRMPWMWYVQLKEPFYVYILIDPRNGKVRYVGCTYRPEQRERQHRASSENKPIGKWMSELAMEGVEPVFAVIEVFEGLGRASDREKELISLYRSYGADLFNLPKGRKDRFGKRRGDSATAFQFAT